MKIKLCGMFRECDIDFANEAKPDYIGFVMGFPKSHRNVSPEFAGCLKKRLSPDIKTVGVFVNAPIEMVANTATSGIIDLIQLHGSEDDVYITKLREKTSAPIIKAVKVRSAEDISNSTKLADFLLLDNGTGTGKMFDHEILMDVEIPKPFFLAGGLTPENLADIPLNPLPYAVDLSSGIESDKVKDKSKMLAAVQSARLL
ncbi:MAG: phosphoribosylanthranilate isomerase [Oscillospiraceae bacterium]